MKTKIVLTLFIVGIAALFIGTTNEMGNELADKKRYNGVSEITIEQFISLQNAVKNRGDVELITSIGDIATIEYDFESVADYPYLMSTGNLEGEAVRATAISVIQPIILVSFLLLLMRLWSTDWDKPKTVKGVRVVDNDA